MIIKLPFDSPEFHLVWTEWLQYRHEKRIKNYTPTGYKRTMAALVANSGNNADTAIKMLIQSMENDWQGIFPLKSTGYGNAHSKPAGPARDRGTSSDRIKKASEW